MNVVQLFLGIIWVGFAIAVAIAARNRRRSSVLYFLTSLLFTPILAIILLAISGGLKATQRPPESVNSEEATFLRSRLARGRQAINNIVRADQPQPMPKATVAAPPPWEKKP